MTPSASDLEYRLLAFAQRRDNRTVASGELVDALGIGPEQERKLLSRLGKRGYIVRVRRGLYLVPERLPVGGRWSPSEALVLETLMADCGGAYQISGPNGFSRYGWDEQIPNQVYAYNDRISGRRKIGSVRLTLIKVRPQRLGATVTVRTHEGIDLIYASKARALMDAVYDWSRFNSLPRAFAWIGAEITRDDDVAADLVAVTLKYGNQGTRRRIGCVLDSAGVSEPLLRKLEKSLRSTTSYIPLVPSRPKRGTTDKRWKVLVNDGSTTKGNRA